MIDNRTGKSYEIPIEHNAIPATAFKKMTAAKRVEDREEDELEGGIRIYDPGMYFVKYLIKCSIWLIIIIICRIYEYCSRSIYYYIY